MKVSYKITQTDISTWKKHNYITGIAVLSVFHSGEGMKQPAKENSNWVNLAWQKPKTTGGYVSTRWKPPKAMALKKLRDTFPGAAAV